MISTAHHHRLLLGLSLMLLASCASSDTPAGDNGEGETGTQALLHRTAPSTLAVDLHLRVLDHGGGRTVVGIVVRNARRRAIQSVRSWIQFDPRVATVEDLTILDQRFSLSPPGEREIAATEGMVRLGVATPSAVQDEELLLASLAIIPRSRWRGVRLTFYDWRADGEGHTAVLSVNDRGIPIPLLRLPDPFVLP